MLHFGSNQSGEVLLGEVWVDQLCQRREGCSKSGSKNLVDSILGYAIVSAAHTGSKDEGVSPRPAQPVLRNLRQT